VTGSPRPDRSRWIGASIPRREDQRLVTGHGRYVDDISLPGILAAAFVRSSRAHARLKRIAVEAARTMPGVVGVYTHPDVPEFAVPLPPVFTIPPGLKPCRQLPMAKERVRYTGEIVAVVVAEDRYVAADAVDAIGVEYEDLPIISTVDEAIAPGATPLHDDWGDNVCVSVEALVGNPTAATREADLVVAHRFTTRRLAGTALETRGLLATVDGPDGLLIWVSSQLPFLIRDAVARLLGLRYERVRVIAPDMGGGFGSKGNLYPEDVIVPVLAHRLKRPVKWVETRRENLTTAGHDRDQIHDIKLGVMRDGRIVAMEDDFYRDCGAYTPFGGVLSLNTLNHLMGQYRVRNFRARGVNVVSNKAPSGAYRGAGRPEAVFAVERIIERAGRALGLDSAEMRLKNLITPSELPYQPGTVYRDGVRVTYDGGDFPTLFHKALQLLGYDELRTQQRAWRASGRYLGIGLATYMEGTGAGPFESATVRVDDDGYVWVQVGVTSQGQGHETTLAQICADALGVDVERVLVRQGDTRLISHAFATAASRVLVNAGNAVHLAAIRVRQKAAHVAAEMLECAPEDIVLVDGRLTVKGVPHRSLSLDEVARASVLSPAATRVGGPGLSATSVFHPPTVTWGSGVHAVALEVDPDTGELRFLRYIVVHDCGQPVNPLLVEAQVLGGTVQGLSAARFEKLTYDPSGQLLTATLLDYSLAVASQVPPIDVVHFVYPSPSNPLGVRGVGEAGAICPPAAIANAVEDALSPFEVQIDEAPVTPERIVELVRWSRHNAVPRRRPASPGTRRTPPGPRDRAGSSVGGGPGPAP
jgi:carbon-monoxide dehydrogenase large subunit